MKDRSLQNSIFQNLSKLRKGGFELILVHGGGPFIQQTLNEAKIVSEFIDGHRKTSLEAMPYIEMALKGKVNGQLVRLSQLHRIPAVGLSGKDGNSVIAKKRWHLQVDGDKTTKIDIGQVGDVDQINTHLCDLLLTNDYLPIFTCIASDKNGDDFNINADMFAGHLAGALNVDSFIVLTDVNGLMRDLQEIDSLIHALSVSEIPALRETVIKGGMIPKVEACEIALENGAHRAIILNGTQPEQLCEALLENKKIGTTITK